MASEAALMAVVEALRTEQHRRARMLHQEIGDSREVLYRKLDQMRERRFGVGAPPRPLSAPEMADLEEFLRGLRREQYRISSDGGTSSAYK